MTTLSALDPRLIGACVHCGYCLPTCPTYALWSDETDSPRGRVLLMKASLEGRLTLDQEVVRHFDACLGCLACVTACPSGVDYAHLIEATRSQVERSYRRRMIDRLVRRLLFAIFPHPRRLRVLALGLVLVTPVRAAAERLGIVRRLPRALATFVRLAPSVTLDDVRCQTPRHLAATGTPRYRVGLFLGCVQRVFHGAANVATARVLAAEGCDVVAPRDQGCCGALAVHTGGHEEARRRARHTIAAFEALGLNRIVVNAAGCGSTLKDYGTLLADDPDWADRARVFASIVRDAMEFLAELGEPRAPRHSVAVRAVYQDACHLLHGQGVNDEPREVLARIPDLEVIGIDDAGMCCGSGGVYNVLQPTPALELGRRKADNIQRVLPELVLSPNPGCRIQLEAAARGTGASWRVVHPIEVVDASIRGSSVR